MTKSERNLSTLVLMAIAGVIGCGAVNAAPDTSTTAAATTPSNTSPAAPAASTPAAPATVAGTVANYKTEEQQLRRMAEAIKRVRRTGLDIIGECTQPLEMIGEIDIIGQDIIPIMPATAEGFGQQYIPPRPKYVKLHVDQLAALLPILKDEIDTLVIPEEEKQTAAKPIADMRGNLDDLGLQLATAQKMVAAEDYNQFNLTNVGRGIDSACKNIEIARKQLLHEEVRLEKKEEKIEKK